MMNAPGEAGIDFRQVAHVLARRRWLVVAPWAAALLVGVALAFLLPPVYNSTVTLAIVPPPTLTENVGNMVRSSATPDQQADLMRQQVQSTLFLRNVATTVGLDKDPAVRARLLEHFHRSPGFDTERYILDALVAKLRPAIMVRRDKGDVVQIVASDPDPHRAKLLAAAVADELARRSRSSQVEVARATQQFSIEQQEIYKRQLEESETRLRQAQLQAGAEIAQDDPGTGGVDVGKARGLGQEASAEVLDQRDRVATLRRQLGGQAVLANRLSSPRVAELGGQIVGLERQLSGAMLAGGPDNGSSARILISRKFGELESELSQNAQTRLGDQPEGTRDLLVRYRLAQADLAAREAGLAYFSGQSATVRRRRVQPVGESPVLARLQQEVENNRQIYNSFVQQAAAAQISQAYESTQAGDQFQVLEPATTPGAPAKPNRLMLILLSFVLGGILGVGTVLVVEQHDESVKNAEEIENLLGLPVLGAVPRVEELERVRRRRGQAPAKDRGLLHRLRVESAMGLEFRRIFLKLARSRGRALPRTLLLTSATRGEGKTTTAAALAITLARELHDRVLLVDFDLRAPSLHRALGLPAASWGLAQILQQRTFDERFVRGTSIAGLDFLPAGRTERPAGELVDLAAVEWFIQEVTKRYAVVVIDAAPNLAVPDPLIVGRAVEAVLYVIKAGSTVRKAAEYGVKVQRDARDNVIGVLLNDVGEVLPAYYGYRADTYGYTPEVAGGES